MDLCFHLCLGGKQFTSLILFNNDFLWSGLLSSPHALLNLHIHGWLIRQLLNRLALTVTFGTRHSIALKIVYLSLLITLCTNVYFHIISVGKFVFTLIIAITSDILKQFAFFSTCTSELLHSGCKLSFTFHAFWNKLNDQWQWKLLFFHIAFYS